MSLGLRPADSEAWFFSMDEDGVVNWMLKLAGEGLQGGEGVGRLYDSCEGMVYDLKTETIIAVVETDSPQFRVRSQNP